jgi:hypothetical protein
LPDIATSLSLHYEGNDPCQNLDHQQHRTDPKHRHQRPELATIQFRAATHVQSKVTFNQVECEWLPFRRLEVRGANENSQSRRGHSTDSTAKPSSAKQPIAIHAAALMSCFTSVWPPKKDVVMAAAAISAPARARSSTTDLS